MQLALCPYLILTEINILSVSVPDGKPVIDFIPNLSNILIATGHEGSGLTLVSR
jgi:glycine/D-amino acid oxidase-like deaminating enzyme